MEDFKKLQKKNGNLYHFDIPEDYELLDWDLPLFQQSRQVQEKLKSMLNSLAQMGFSGSNIYKKAFFSQLGGIDITQGRAGNITGGMLYQNIMDFMKQEILKTLSPEQAREAFINHDKNILPEAKVRTSQIFNEFGIPGHKFLDKSKTGSHNFVIWNTDKIKMTGIDSSSDSEAIDAFNNGGKKSESESYNQQVLEADEQIMRADKQDLTPEAQRQLEAVRKKYEGTDKWLKAPNGKKSNLSEQQWLIVRTPNFKRWFGNWNYDENTPVKATKIDVNDLPFDWKDTKKLKQWLKDNFAGKEVSVDLDGTIVGFSVRGLNDSLKRRGEEQRSVYAVLDDVIRNSVFFDFVRVDDKQKHEHLVGQDIYYSAIILGDKIFPVKISLDVNKDTQRTTYKGHKTITDITITPAVFMAETVNGVPSQSNVEISVGELTQHVKPESSKILDANGEPLIVYHGTLKGNNFSIFRTEPQGGHFGTWNAALERIAQQVDLPAYLLDKGRENISLEDIANIPDSYYYDEAGKVFECFLNIRNPIRVEDAGDDWDTVIAEAKAKGADGLVYENEMEDVGSDSFVIFSDKQPKSSNLNNGNFSLSDPDIYHQIIGEKGASNLDARDSSTSRMDSLRIAQDMERAGKSPKVLWAATGWMRGVDGEWRHEIPDAKFKPKYRKAIKKINPQSPEIFERLKFKAQGRDFDNEEAADKEIQQAFHTAKTIQELQTLVADIHKKYNIPLDADNLPVDLDNLSPNERKQFQELDDILHNSTLRNIFDAPELFAAYPDLANIPVLIEETGDDKTYAFYNPNENAITLNINHLEKLKELRNTIIHETQHAIQEIEGFARGSNEELFKSKANANGEIIVNPFLRKSFKRQEKLIFDSLTPELQKQFRSLKRKEASLSPEEFSKLLETSLSEDDRRRYSQWRYAQNGLASLDDNNPKTLQDPYMAYYATAGEVEARNAETRSNWGEKRRRNTPLNESEFEGHGGEIQQEFRLVMDKYGKAYRQNHIISPEQIERFNQLAYTGTGNIIRGNKFDLRFVGSNEGGAMFGYGAYLAEVKKVAGNYRGFALSDEDLRGNTVITLKNGQSFSINENSQWKNPAVGRALFQISHYLKNSPEATNEQVIAGVREDYKYLIKTSSRDKELVKRLKEELHVINSISELHRTTPKKGNIYSFDIPENYELLDWDAELDNQPPKVKAGIQKLFDALETLGFSQDDLRNYSTHIGELETGEDLYTAVVGAMEEYLAQNPNTQDGITRADARASLLFNQAGIPGHRYFDRDSRGRQKGTHNFVIWDTDRMKMLDVEGDIEAEEYFRNFRDNHPNNFMTDKQVETYNQDAYHGTRHIIKGNNFDLAKFGSGEGSAAFGWGAYLAQNINVAQSYRKSGLDKFASIYEFHTKDGRIIQTDFVNDTWNDNGNKLNPNSIEADFWRSLSKSLERNPNALNDAVNRYVKAQRSTKT